MASTNVVNLINGVYEKCASHSTNTLNNTPGTMMVTYCNVSLSQNVTCTKIGERGEQVPQQAVSNCQAALHATVQENTTALIAGK